jgi:hypothetical protein
MGPTVALEVESFDDPVALLKTKDVPFVDGPHESSVCFMAMVPIPMATHSGFTNANPGKDDASGQRNPLCLLSGY